MGKGVPAGLIMTMTRGMLRAEVLNRHSPARVLQHLNQVMYADLENSHRFVTLFYSEYDPETTILSYSNAAHHPPMLWQAASNSIVNLDTLGMLIGLEVDSEYNEAQVKLHPGDTIIYHQKYKFSQPYLLNYKLLEMVHHELLNNRLHL